MKAGPLFVTGFGQGPDDRPRAFAVPFGVSAHPGDFPAVHVKDHGSWKAENPHAAGEVLSWIEKEREVVDTCLLEEPADARKGIAPCGNGHDFEPFAAEFALQFRKHRHFLAAGCAPGGPEVHEHELAVEVGQLMCTPFGVGKAGVGHGLRFRKDKFPHRSLTQILEPAGVRAGVVCSECKASVENGEETGHLTPSGDQMTDDANKMWGGRFDAGPDAIMEAINASIGFDQRLARHDIEGSLAHAAMLAATGIITDSDAKAIREGLLTVLSEIETGTFRFQVALEDIHMNIESRLQELIGTPAGRLHTARSRNDQVATDLRLWVRDQCDAAIAGIRALQRALVDQAEAGADWVMPGFTHLQTAQPVTWGHHMMAYVEMLERDASRLADARNADERMSARGLRLGRNVLSNRPGCNGECARI